MMDVKTIILFAATFTTLLLTALASSASTTGYVVRPDCSSLAPKPCTHLPVFDYRGDVSYDEYEESCPYHICTTINPIYPIASNTTGSTMSMISEQRYYDLPSDGDYGKSSAAFSSIKGSSQANPLGQNYNASGPWFCSGSHINYTTRVEDNTGFPPGKKEDMYAQCQYLQLLDAQSLGDCRHMRFTCGDCSNYYRNWLCAMAFPRCYPENTVTTYPVYNASDPRSLVPTKIFGILKPCRGLCWGVVQRCQSFVGFNCPMTDKRDYGDYPNCNAFGFDVGTTPYAKSIYW